MSNASRYVVNAASKAASNKVTRNVGGVRASRPPMQRTQMHFFSPKAEKKKSDK
jgi:hypothetical protein